MAASRARRHTDRILNDMQTKRDYYEVLGVARNASDDEIRKAYRKLARQYHPDINRDGDAEDRFKEINEANEVLSDAQQRAAYDRFGHAAFNGAGGGADPFGGGSPFGDLFESFFGGATTRSRRERTVARGGDIKLNLELTFEEAVFGVEREAQVTRYEPCDDCHGTRMRDGQQAPTCPQCHGTGEMRRVQNTILGQFMTASACDRCGGEGATITDPCPTCRGRGRMTKTRTIAINVPAGVDEQSTLRLSGQGEQIRDGMPGNLFVTLRIKPHKELGRAGKHILYDLPINVSQAALGAEIQVPSVDGPLAFQVPSGTQPSQQFRLRGKGIPDLRGGERGDQLITVHVVIPTELSAEQRELFAQLDNTLGAATMPKERGFFSKVKDALGV
jgi:molecular chaperone DnaJ